MTSNLKKKMHFDGTLIKFGIVGAINTLFGTAIMFFMYNVLNCGYYLSSFCNYLFGSILSYILNKKFTFKYDRKDWKTIVRFAVNILACYLLAYGICRPMARRFFATADSKLSDNIAMVGGMIVFVLLNYCGQRFFVFKKDKKGSEGINDNGNS